MARHVLQLQVRKRSSATTTHNRLQIATDWEIPIRQRSNLFLEVFGNLLLSKRASRYLSDVQPQLAALASGMDSSKPADSIEFCHIVTRGKASYLSRILCFDGIRYKARDQLVDTFNSWSSAIQCDSAYSQPPLQPMIQRMR